MPLTKTTPRSYTATVGPTYNDHTVETDAQIFGGGAVAVVIASGLARALVGNSTVEHFAGFSEQTVLGDGRATVKVRTEGIVQLPVVGVNSADDIGKPVYASDDGTFSLTQGTNDPQIGVVHRHVSGTACMVSFKAATLA